MLSPGSSLLFYLICTHALPTQPAHRIAWLPDLSGAAPPADAEVTVTPAAAWRGCLSAGDSALFAPVGGRLRAGLPLRVLALGGSLTCGAALGNVSRPDRPNGTEDAWPALLELSLNERVALTGGARHSVLNSCRHAVASDTWVDSLAAWAHPSADQVTAPANPFADASFDVVVIETAINDVAELALSGSRDAHLHPDARVRKYVELLLLQLLDLQPRPALLWLTASSREGPWAGGERLGDATWLQAPIIRHHGAAMVSLIDALGPFVSEAQKRFFSYDIRVDGWGHITRLGHALNAGLVLQTLLSQSLSSAPMLPGEAAAAYVPRPPLHVTDVDAAMYLRARPLSISLLRDGANYLQEAGAQGWAVFEDVPGKPGYIANGTGASVTWALDPPLVAAHILSGRLHVTSLRSYKARPRPRPGPRAPPFVSPRAQHMGTLLLELHAGRKDGGLCLVEGARAAPRRIDNELLTPPPGDQAALGRLTIDGLDLNDRSSISFVSELAFDVAPLLGACLRIHASVVESEPRREENKVKLISFVVF